MLSMRWHRYYNVAVMCNKNRSGMRHVICTTI